MAVTIFEKPMGSEVETLKGQIGTLSNLTTAAKGSAVGAINELNSNIATLNSNKISCVRHKLSNGTEWTYIFPNNETTFMLFATRVGVVSTTAEGVFLGGCGSSNAHITPIGTAPSNLEASISGRTLSLTPSTTNMIVTIMYAEV